MECPTEYAKLEAGGSLALLCLLVAPEPGVLYVRTQMVAMVAMALGASNDGW